MSVARVLLESGADINARDVRGAQALHLLVQRAARGSCTYSSDVDFVELLINACADMHAIDNDGCRPIDVLLKEATMYIQEPCRLADATACVQSFSARNADEAGRHWYKENVASSCVSWRATEH